jgi:uncharacterized protein YaiI (UPF0178 family)
MLHIFIDADACPVKNEVHRVAERESLEVTLVANSPMRIPESPKITIEIVGGGFDAADDWIVEHLQPDDIVITADVLLADRCLKVGARVLGTSGKPFTVDNIGSIVANRHLMTDLRGAGDITGGPRPITKRDRSRSLHSLHEMIQAIRRDRDLHHGRHPSHSRLA